MTYILVSNDDGVHADGLPPLVTAVETVAPTKVVVPLENCSGASNKLTLDRPLVPRMLPNGYIAVSGSPADCVYLACQGMFDEEPSFVVSGINKGANLGDDVLYSGTVAAALEGRFLSKSAIAVSLVGSEHYATAAAVVGYLLSHWDEFALPQPCVLNVNVPDLPLSEIAGFAVTRLGRRARAAQISLHENPRGDLGYWIGHAGQGIPEPGTDFHAIAQNFVSLTPLSIDMTHDAMGPTMAPLTESLNQGCKELLATEQSIEKGMANNDRK